ncbi:hypothetical protein, partial [Rhodonellum psychrophilum]|uniref:hypothetical protein n=1 Tax=Rhodonellum psychrophilum TaxID=336828 RepID=UPI000562B9E4
QNPKPGILIPGIINTVIFLWLRERIESRRVFAKAGDLCFGDWTFWVNLIRNQLLLLEFAGLGRKKASESYDLLAFGVLHEIGSCL